MFLNTLIITTVTTYSKIPHLNCGILPLCSHLCLSPHHSHITGLISKKKKIRSHLYDCIYFHTVSLIGQLYSTHSNMWGNRISKNSWGRWGGPNENNLVMNSLCSAKCYYASALHIGQNERMSIFWFFFFLIKLKSSPWFLLLWSCWQKLLGCAEHLPFHICFSL